MCFIWESFCNLYLAYVAINIGSSDFFHGYDIFYPSMTSILDWIKWFSSASISSRLIAGKEVKSEISCKFEQFSSKSWTLFIVRMVECATLKTRKFLSEPLIFSAKTWSEIPVDVPNSMDSNVEPAQWEKYLVLYHILNSIW